MPQPEYPLFPQQPAPPQPQQSQQSQQPQVAPQHAELAVKLAQQLGLPIQAALGFAMKLMTPTAATAQPQAEPPKQDAPYTYIPKTAGSRAAFMHYNTNLGAKRTNTGGQ